MISYIEHLHTFILQFSQMLFSEDIHISQDIFIVNFTGYNSSVFLIVCSLNVCSCLSIQKKFDRFSCFVLYSFTIDNNLDQSWLT